MICCDLLDHSSSVWLRRSRSCERCRSAIVPQDWHKQSPNWCRIDKTLHALNYIDDETKRRRILQQLNKGEDRHKLARAVFHGKRGELRQRYREGQEDQLGALGLVVNVIVLWNTIYINAALQQLEQEGFEIQSEDITRLSPLVFEHINLLGRYAFSLPEAVSRGEL
jgi:hypothetical protein